MQLELSIANHARQYSGPAQLGNLALALIELERECGHIPSITMRLLRATEHRAVQYGEAQYPGNPHVTIRRLDHA